MMDKKKKRIFLIAGLLLIAGVLLLTMIVESPAPEQQSHEVSLRANTNDISLDDMMANGGNKKMASDVEPVIGSSAESQISGEPLDDPDKIARVQALIRESENNIATSRAEIENERKGIPVEIKDDALEIVETPTRPHPSKKKLETAKTDSVVVVPKSKKRSAFNSIAFGSSSSKNAIKAYVHSEQTVMAGSTLKMRLGEDAVTDKGELIPKNSPIFGEVTAIDGERVIVKITHVNFQGNILPFEKQVYSKDAMLGIYVPGNPKADANKEVLGGAVDGLPSTIPGLDAASQIAGVVASTAAAAGKQVASKNVKKIKVTIKTNYEIYLRPEEK